jgi:hypothetical protein
MSLKLPIPAPRKKTPPKRPAPPAGSTSRRLPRPDVSDLLAPKGQGLRALAPACGKAPANCSPNSGAIPGATASGSWAAAQCPCF